MPNQPRADNPARPEGETIMQVTVPLKLDINLDDLRRRTGEDLDATEARAHVIEVARDVLRAAVKDSELAYFAYRAD